MKIHELIKIVDLKELKNNELDSCPEGKIVYSAIND